MEPLTKLFYGVETLKLSFEAVRKASYACFRPSNAKSRINQQHLLGMRSWIHQNLSEFHGEFDGEVLHACGRWENATFCKIR